jgi:hypothetical protein
MRTALVLCLLILAVLGLLMQCGPGIGSEPCPPDVGCQHLPTR